MGLGTLNVSVLKSYIVQTNKKKFISMTGTKVYFSCPNLNIDLQNVKKALNAVNRAESSENAILCRFSLRYVKFRILTAFVI